MSNADNLHLSPGQLAWRRLKRNKLAMTGLFLVVLFHVLCFAAPLFTSQSPSRIRSWIGSLPPGSTSTNCLEENYFAIGEPPQLNHTAESAKHIHIQGIALSAEIYRVSIYSKGSRAGKIKSIQQKAGAIRVDSLDLSKGIVTIVGNSKATVPAVTLQKREIAPQELFADTEVIELQIVDPEQTQDLDIQIEIADGTVNRIVKNGSTLNELRIYGEHINSIVIDDQAATHYHLLGTDLEGRDLFTRILYGGRISLLVGIVATIVSLLIGVFYGALSGYLGGRSDRIMMSTVDVLYALPFMFIVILLLVMFGRNILILFAALGAVQWLTTARIVRGQVLSLKSREFIEAAKVNGASTWCIITRHLLPNAIGPIIVYATLTVPAVILEESFLAFLGLQVEWGDQRLDSWGYLVNAGRLAMNYQTWDHWWLLVWPSLAMILTLFGLNTLGDGLRDALDPQDAGND